MTLQEMTPSELRHRLDRINLELEKGILVSEEVRLQLLQEQKEISALIHELEKPAEQE